MTKEIRYCSSCKTPIEKGFLCDACKKKKKAKLNAEQQHAYYLRRKQALKNLQEENAKLKQIIEELKHAN